MALLRRKRRAAGTQPTDPGQVGAAAVPAAHAANGSTGSYDERRDEVVPDARTRDDGIIPAVVRGWRLPTTSAPGPQGPMPDSDDAVPEVHIERGRPDARRLFTPGPEGAAGYAGGPKHEELRVSAEHLHNTNAPVVIAADSAPARVRAGSTGADPARLARMPRWLFFRPMDWSADRLGVTGITKLEEASPLASLPIWDAADIVGAVPSPSGTRAAGMSPVGVTPNTVRLAPRAWDELAVTTQLDPSPEGARRAGGWRAR